MPIKKFKPYNIIKPSMADLEMKLSGCTQYYDNNFHPKFKITSDEENEEFIKLQRELADIGRNLGSKGTLGHGIFGTISSAFEIAKHSRLSSRLRKFHSKIDSAIENYKDQPKKVIVPKKDNEYKVIVPMLNNKTNNKGNDIGVDNDGLNP